jgi:Tfp pilus assembly protein PilF
MDESTEELHKARALMRSGDYAGARDALEPLASHPPPRVEALIMLGQTLYKLGDHVGALGAAERALAVRPGNGSAVINKARALMHLDRWSDAIAFLTPACAEAPASAPLWSLLSHLQEKTGDLAGASESLGRAIALSPDDVRLHRRRTDLTEQAETRVGEINRLSARGRWSEAAAAAEQACETRPNDAECYSRWVQALMGAKQVREAWKVVVSARERGLPTDVILFRFYSSAADLLTEQGDEAGAIKALLAALAVNPDHVPSLRRAAAYYLAKGDRAGAEPYRAQIIALREAQAETDGDEGAPEASRAA